MVGVVVETGVPEEARLEVKGSAAGSQLVLLGATAGRLVLSLLITVVLGRVLPPEDFGFFALVSAIFVIGRELIDLGTGNIAAREIARTPGAEIRILSALLGGRRLISVGLAVVCASFAIRAADPVRETILVLSAIVVALLYQSAFQVVFQVRQAFVAPTLLGIGVQVLMLGACLAVVPVKVAGTLVAVFVLIRELAIVLGTRLLALRFLADAPRARLRGVRFKEFYGTALIFGLASVFYNLVVHGGTFFTWFLRSNVEVGAYSAAFRPIYPLMSFPWVLMIPMVPVLSHLAGRERSAFAEQVGAGFRVFAAAGLIIAIAGYMLAPSALRIMYGGHFVGGQLDATAAFRWLCLAFGFSSVMPALATGLLADGKERILLWLGIAGAVVDLMANLILVPKFGFTGAAASSAISECALLFGALLWAWRMVGGGALWRHFVPFLVPPCVLSGALHVLPDSSRLKLVAGALLTLSALVAVWMLPSARRLRMELHLVSKFDVGTGEIGS